MIPGAGKPPASNIARRHMSKGQQAMAVAMMYPEPAKTKRKVRFF